jgi:beta-lactamase regulating signal transducer with metallopeptidase domain
MAEFMKTLLWLSAAGAALGLILFAALRLCGGRLSRAFAYYMWLAVLLRLILPVASPLPADIFAAGAQKASLPAAQTAQTSAAETAAAAPQTPAEAAAPETQPGAAEPAAEASGFSWDALFWVWAAGAAGSAAWFALSYAKYCRGLMRAASEASEEERAVLNLIAGWNLPALVKSPAAGTPMLLGAFRPVIVLPEREYSADELENILRHELAHLRRRDIIYKWFAAAVTALHWFNPLMIPLRRELARECELACDEAAVRGMTEEGRRAYGNTLIRMSAERPLPAGVPATTMCEEKRQLKGRLMSIKNYGVHKSGAAALSVVLSLLLAGCAAVSGPAVTAEAGEAIYDGTAYSTASGTTTAWPAWLNTGTNECGIAYKSGSDYELWYKDGTVVPLTEKLYAPETAGDYSHLGVFVSPEKTVLAFGSTVGAPVTVRVSGDEGKTWQSAEIPFNDGAESVLTGFSTTENGWLLTCSPPALGAEQHSLFTTADGGKTWKKVKSDLDKVYGRVVTGANFIDADTGFVCFRYEDGDFAPAVCVTRDGGRTWQKLDVKAGTENVSLTPLSPAYSGKLIALPAFYSDDSGERATTFISSDRGATWTEAQPAVKFYGAGGNEITAQNGVYNLPGDSRAVIALDGFGECTVNLSAVVRQKSLAIASNHASGSLTVPLEAFLSAADSGTDAFTLEVTVRSGYLTLAYRTFTVRPAG